MDTPKPTPERERTLLIKLADIDDTVRIRAARRLMNETDDISEYLRLLELAYIPGDANGRVAA